MPELPEVESVRRILARSLPGRIVISAIVREPRLRCRVHRELARDVAGLRIERLERRAKYLILHLSGGRALLVHLGMSGSLTHRNGSFTHKSLDVRHDHICFVLDDGSELVFNDPRRFGLVKLTFDRTLNREKELNAIGPEPLGSGFTASYLADIARGRKAAIKNLLMDQRVVGGIGNIYACEILFRAGVRPTRRAGAVRRSELARIVAVTPEILRSAISNRGTTFRSYVDSSGRPGQFVKKLKVYGREGKKCYVCSVGIKKVIVGQRASFYCPKCQK